MINSFLTLHQRSYHDFVLVRKLLEFPLYTLSIETSRVFSTILGNLERKHKNFLANPILLIHKHRLVTECDICEC